MKRSLSVLMLLSALLVTVPVQAQEPPPGTLQLDSGWSLEPIVHKGVIAGYYGELPREKAVGRNVTRVWLHATPDGRWALYGWGEGSRSEAVEAIRSYYGNAQLLQGLVPGTVDSITPCSEQIAAVRPQPMTLGLLPSDPFAQSGDALSVDLLRKVINEGAAGAPDLSVLQQEAEVCSEQPISRLESGLSLATDQFEHLLGLNSSARSAAEGNKCFGFCFPGTYTVWGPWSAWSCTGPPTIIAGCGGSGGCRYTGCTRSRTGTKVYVSLNCTGTVTGTVTQTQGPGNKTCALPASGICPPQPAC